MTESETEISPTVSYAYHNYMGNASNAIGGPLFILVYIQCVMFMINSWLNLSMELWQLVFPTFILIMSTVVGLMNRG